MKIFIVIAVLGIVIYAVTVKVIKKMQDKKRHPRLDTNGLVHIKVQGKDFKFDPFEEPPVENCFTADADKSLEALRAENRRWAEQAEVLFGHQRRGMEFEKEGRSEDAVEEYEAAVAFGRAADKMTVNQYFYSLERLCVLYRRIHLYDNEVATIRIALGEYINDKDRERLADRLVKAQKLQEKQQLGR